MKLSNEKIFLKNNQLTNSAGSAITLGAGSIVNGNVNAGGAFTSGAFSTVTGCVYAAGAITLGASSVVQGGVHGGIHANVTVTTSGAGVFVGKGSCAPNIGPNSASCADITTVIAGVTLNGDVCSSTAFTSGAGSIINGNIVAVAGVTLGANSFVYGSINAGAAFTSGANSVVSGNVHAGSAATLGANSIIKGSLFSGTNVYNYGSGATVGTNANNAVLSTLANGKGCADITTLVAGVTLNQDICSSSAFTTGANSILNGNIITATAVTLGANSYVNGNINAGSAFTSGTSSIVTGNVYAGAAITLGAASTINGGAVSAIGTITYGDGATVGSTSPRVSAGVQCVDITNLFAGVTLNQDVCSSSAFTSGANSIVNGNIVAAT